MPALAFFIDAPLQSWGLSSKFQYRDTNAFPTKSALIGLTAAAMGIDKHADEEAEKLAPLTVLKTTVIKLRKPRAETTRLSDFHTVGGGFDKSASLREKLSIPRKASGAPFGTVLTHRSYLTDAAFISIFEGDANLLNDIREALANPTWGVWFGRKACLPASPLSPTLGEDRQSALDALLDALPNWKPAPLESLEYQEDRAEGIFFQSDRPVAYGRHHAAVPQAYRSRGIYHHRPATH